MNSAVLLLASFEGWYRYGEWQIHRGAGRKRQVQVVFASLASGMVEIREVSCVAGGVFVLVQEVGFGMQG